MRRIVLCLALLLAPGLSFADGPKRTQTMIVTFTIKDYAAWRPVFDAAAPERAKVGVLRSHVYRDADAPDDLLVVFDVKDAKSGRAWMTSADVRAAWEKGGVIGTPAYRFLR